MKDEKDPCEYCMKDCNDKCPSYSDELHQLAKEVRQRQSSFSAMVTKTVEMIEEKLDEELCEECNKSLDKCSCKSGCCGADIIYGDICSNCKEHI